MFSELRARRFLIAVLVCAAFPAIAEACPICFREAESPMTAGVMAGVGTLLTITGGVFGGFVVLMRRIIRAERDTPRSGERRGGE